MEIYTLYREDPETGEDIEIELEVEIAHFHPGSIPHPLAISDDPAELDLGDIYRVDTGERFEPTSEELDQIRDNLFERLMARRYSRYDTEEAF